MCGVCGCGEGEARVEARLDASGGEATTAQAELKAEIEPHIQTESVAGSPMEALREAPDEQARRVRMEQDILSVNNGIAAHNRTHFASHNVLALNLVSSPGAGKTSLLVSMLEKLAGEVPVAVIEGDQETTADAERIRSTGTPALQVNTGKGCHLDARMIDRAFAQLHVHDGLLFIENVGNLVCPAGFDLGEAHKVVICSVTEGEDKPLKYPNMFAASSLMLVSKVDLLPHLDFDVEALISNARRVNPNIAVIQVSARTGEGLDRWLQWVDAARQLAAASR